MVVILTPIVLMVVGIPGYSYFFYLYRPYIDIPPFFRDVESKENFSPQVITHTYPIIGRSGSSNRMPTSFKGNPGSPKTKLCPLVGSGILYMDHPKDHSLFSLGLPGGTYLYFLKSGFPTV